MATLWVIPTQPSFAQQKEANVLRPAWEALSESEREYIRASHIIMVADPADFGLIVDAQGVDQSTPGSNAGSVAGGAVGSVGYIDHALRRGNYSPGKHLAFGLLGVLIGSAANSDPVSRFQFRYAIKMSDGEIVTRDVVQSDPFRHSAGMCLSLSAVLPVSKAMCGQTADEIRAKYISPTAAVQVAETKADKAPEAASVSTEKTEVSGEEKITCKLKDQAPVFAMRQQCEILGGSVL